jgi:hypothetical protein
MFIAFEVLKFFSQKNIFIHLTPPPQKKKYIFFLATALVECILCGHLYDDMTWCFNYNGFNLFTHSYVRWIPLTVAEVHEVLFTWLYLCLPFEFRGSGKTITQNDAMTSKLISRSSRQKKHDCTGFPRTRTITFIRVNKHSDGDAEGSPIMRNIRSILMRRMNRPNGWRTFLLKTVRLT